MRYGEMTAFGERPHSPYYGNADATPLYVVLLDEYERWTGDTKLVRELEYEARAVLHWIDEYANLRGDGYIWYQRRNEKTGLENQCWKDSWDSISTRDGTIPGFPRATCELQGYAYDAKMRAARLARTVWNDAAFADDLEKQAADLKRRFNRDFWVAKDEYFALARRRERPPGRRARLEQRPPALERHRRQVEGEGRRSAPDGTANVLRVGSARRSRTGQGRYNPIGYHVGTVWPFDNSFIAWGLRRYGFKKEAAQIAVGNPRCRRILRRSTPRSLRPDTSATQPSTRCSTRPRAAHKRGPPERRCYSCAPCSASNQQATSSSSTRCSPKASVRSSYSTFPAAGATSTPSPANGDRCAPSLRRDQQ